MIEDAKKNRRNLTPSPRAEQRIQTSPGKRWGSNSPLVHQRKHSIEDHHIHVKQTSDSSMEFGHSNGVLSDSPGSTMDRLTQRLVATPESSTKQLVPIDERYGEIAYNRNTSHSSSVSTNFCSTIICSCTSLNTEHYRQGNRITNRLVQRLLWC